MTALVVAVVLVPLAAAPLPAWLKRFAGLDPAWPALGATLAAFALLLALLPAAISVATPLAAWRWLPALGLGVALRADVLGVGLALAVTAASVLAIVAVRLDPRGRAAPNFYGCALALTGATLGAVLAEDLAFLWFCLEVAALASVLLLGGAGSAAARRRDALAAFAVLEAGGLALLAGVLLIADFSGSFRLSAALAAGAELRAQALYLPTAGLVLAGAALRLAPWRVGAGQRRAALPAGAALAAAVLVPLRLAPVLGGTRAWLVLLTALGASSVLIVAWRSWRAHRAGAGRPGPPGPSLLEDFALAARIVWRPLSAPRLAWSLAALAAGAAAATALAVGGVRPGAWPALRSAAWPIAAGSSWLLLAVGACAARDRAARILALAAAAALLLLASFAPAAIVGAELLAGAAALWLLGRTLGVAAPSRPALLALGASLAIAAAVGALLVGAPGAPTGGDAGHGAAPAELTVLVPVALPLAAALALFVLGRAALVLKRTLAATALLANLALAAWLLVRADDGPPLGLALGAGPAPFGIHLLLDRLAALVLLTGAAVAVLVFGHSLGGGVERRRRHFHALCQLQVCGIAGAVLAADLVDLFVFVEIMALAFGGLLAADAGGARAAARTHVAVVGAAGSGLFLIAAGCVYAALGTLGFAELAVRAPATAAGDSPLLSVGAYLLLVVLALRAAALPFGFWLAHACEAARASAAFAAVLAATGVYAILRLYALVFPCFGAGPCGASGLVLPLGLATLTGGGVAALAATGLGGLRAPLTAVAVGTLLVGVGSFREAGFAAALYLLAPAAIGAAALALGSDLAGHARLAPVARGRLGVATLLAALGLPPFAAWAGRIGILAASGPDVLVVWSLVLVTGLVAAIAAARAVSEQRRRTEPAPARVAAVAVAATAAALMLVAALAVAAGPLYDFAARSARQLLDRQAYVAALTPVGTRPAPH